MSLVTGVSSSCAISYRIGSGGETPWILAVSLFDFRAFAGGLPDLHKTQGKFRTDTVLVNAFDAAGQVSGWAVTHALLNTHLSGSDSAAIGGDLAYQYGNNGYLTGIGLIPARDVINSARFGSSPQGLHKLEELQQGQIRLS